MGTAAVIKKLQCGVPFEIIASRIFFRALSTNPDNGLAVHSRNERGEGATFHSFTSPPPPLTLSLSLAFLTRYFCPASPISPSTSSLSRLFSRAENPSLATRSRQLRKNPRSFFFSDSTKGKGIVSKNFSSRIGFKIFRFPFDPRAPAWKRNAELYPGIRFIISFNSFLY